MRVQTDENSHKFSVEIYSDFVAFVISRDPDLDLCCFKDFQ